jgi:hypothetical protein
VNGERGNDVININGGRGSDNITYNVSEGNDRVRIDGGGHWFTNDTATINLGNHNVTVVDSRGNIIYRNGDGGSHITVDNIDNLTILGPDGKPVHRRNG